MWSIIYKMVNDFSEYNDVMDNSNLKEVLLDFFYFV